MIARSVDDRLSEALAINEVSLPTGNQTGGQIRIRVDSVTRLPELICDGVLIATPGGSTASTFRPTARSFHGSGVLALTPISAFRPRRWRGAICRMMQRSCSKCWIS